ncbi:acyltransferase [Luteibacter sp. dw_328]|uniref:acyltransferase family protein n=1 Tax=Luteibacter sp. dw_328 TaxID=2719796 RepID=UPI001BD69663|nr:acyltransferase [Luteibacter sp. dw_328]
MTERSAYFRNADGIRGLACLVVLLVHSVNGIFIGARPYLPGTGKVGVWLFFVLSAFLLTNHLFLRGTTMRSLADYVLARCLRIVPLFVIAVVFYFFFGTTTITTWADVTNALTLTKGYAHLWTVPVELKFYVLLFPLAVPTIAIYNRFGPMWSATFVLACGVVSSVLFPFTGTTENSPELRWYIPCFLIGMLCAVIYPSIKARAVRMPSVAISVLVIAAIVAMTDYFRAMYYPDAPHYWLGNKFVPLGALWAVFMLVNLDDTGPMGRLLASRAMTNVGRWSYPIYLFHWYFVTRAAELRPNSLVSVLVAIILAITIGAVAHRYVERPIMSARGMLGRSILRRPAAA